MIFPAKTNIITSLPYSLFESNYEVIKKNILNHHVYSILLINYEFKP